MAGPAHADTRPSPLANQFGQRTATSVPAISTTARNALAARHAFYGDSVATEAVRHVFVVEVHEDHESVVVECPGRVPAHERHPIPVGLAEDTPDLIGGHAISNAE